jgi:DNA-binding response OmpR family regulator
MHQQETNPTSDDTNALRTLVVEDEPVHRDLIARAARQAGHKVDLATSCAEAIRLLGQSAYDCVTLDLSLTDGDGLQVLAAMERGQFAGQVVVLSGASSIQRRVARLAASSMRMQYHGLPKPLDFSALRALLSKMKRPPQDQGGEHAALCA